LPKEQRQGRALCLSGGGYRAALFHLGAFRRLNELGLLGKIDTFTSVSGGSVASAVLAAHIASLPDGQVTGPDGVIPGFEVGVAQPLRRLAGTNIRTRAALTRLKPGNWRNGNAASDALASRYTGAITDRVVADLPRHPRFVFCATDLSFRTQWTVDTGHGQVGDDEAGYIRPVPPVWSVARAVAASSCFPILFGPVAFMLDPAECVDGQYQGVDRARLLGRMALTDGGIYDNLALEPVWRDHELVLVSDGGPSFRASPDLGIFWRGLRYIVTLLEQSTDVRKRWLIANFIQEQLAGAYWGMGSIPSHYEPAAGATVYPDDLVDEYISQVRIEFDAHSDGEIRIIENHGYLMTDLAIRKHAIGWAPNPDAPLEPPWPEWLKPDKARRALAKSHRHKVLGRGRWW
jgi:NTE family protein